MKYFRLFIYLVIMFMATSCMTSHQLNYLQTGFDIPVYPDSVKFTNYQLQKGDYLSIQIYTFNQSQLDYFNGTNGSNSNMMNNNLGVNSPAARLYLYKVEDNGCIKYPYVGEIPVENKTLRQVKFILEDSLKSVLHDFSVDVRLASNTFYKIGEAGYGTYTMPKNKITIFEALAMTGDLSTYSNRKKIQIIRQQGDSTVIKTFDIRSKSIINSEFYYIQPNDIIYVPFTNAKLFGITHFTGIFSIVLSTASFVLLFQKLKGSE